MSNSIDINVKPLWRMDLHRENTLEGIKILVAEPSHDVGELIEFQLRRRGAEVKIVRDGKAVLPLLLNSAGKVIENGFDVLLVELEMPWLDGITTAQQLREAGYRRPIIAFTISSDVASTTKCERLGFDGYVRKPFVTTELVQCILYTVGHRAGGVLV